MALIKKTATLAGEGVRRTKGTGTSILYQGWILYSNGDRIFLDGSKTTAVEAWQQVARWLATNHDKFTITYEVDDPLANDDGSTDSPVLPAATSDSTGNPIG